MHFPSAHTDSPPAARRLALKIDVDSLPGAMKGVPALIELLRGRSAAATFLFSLGPDRSGRSLRSFVRTGPHRGSTRPGPIERYGIKGLLHGTLLPAPMIGECAESNIRAAADAEFEVGLRPWDCHAWQRLAAHADAAWTQTQMQRAFDRFVTIFGASPRIHGASAWQMNRHAFRLTQRLGFDYCSDTRGFRPYVPVQNAELIACPQIPTTLPTFDELLSDAKADRENVVERMVEAFATPAPDGHVLSVSADCEGTVLRPALERFLDRLQSQGVTFMSLGQYLGAAGAADLARHRLHAGVLPGVASPMTMQFKEFLP